MIMIEEFEKKIERNKQMEWDGWMLCIVWDSGYSYRDCGYLLCGFD